MPKPRAYVETTIPSFYHDDRASAAVISRRAATRLWWATAVDRYELVTSTIVRDELGAGTGQAVSLRQQMLAEIQVLPLLPEIHDIVDVYLANKLMPARPPDDAVHLALASYNKCDFIVTWNCRHLANPNKITHIRQINARLGLRVPRLVTPLDLLKEVNS
jgi:predicted nucleic acid-binding protein